MVNQRTIQVGITGQAQTLIDPLAERLTRSVGLVDPTS